MKEANAWMEMDFERYCLRYQCLVIIYRQSLIIVVIIVKRYASEAKQRPFEMFFTIALEHLLLCSRPQDLYLDMPSFILQIDFVCQSYNDF